MTAVASVDDQLAWEAEKRKPAAAAAIGGGLLSLAGFLVTILSLRGANSQSLAQSLARFDSSTPIADQPSLRLVPYQFFADHGAAIIIGGVLVGLGAVAMAIALTFLSRATRARHERYPSIALWLPLVGGVLSGLGTILSAVGRVSFYNGILDGPGTVQAVRDFNPSSVLYVGQFVQLIGGLALALAFVIVALNAMRVGLLTRFMGIMGILAGALTILPLPAVPVLQAFFLVALGALFLRVWPGGAIPPAWVTGRSEPWPPGGFKRQAQAPAPVAKGKGRRPVAPPEPEDVETRATGKPHPSSKKKRKRRS